MSVWINKTIFIYGIRMKRLFLVYCSEVYKPYKTFCAVIFWENPEMRSWIL